MRNTFYTLLLIAITNVAIGQMDNGIDDEKADKYVVGAIGGTVDVTALGGASYTIPIRLPDGINGMQPSLSIIYNSQSGNGLLGWGWNIAGISAITRIGQTLYHDGCMDGVNFEDDRFALDGQRLMLVNDREYGANEAEYRTEIDGMAKIVSYTCDTTNGPACFKVWLPNGNIAYYGYKANTRIGLLQRNDVCMWMLDSIVDRNGNYVAYRYTKEYYSCRLKTILYTGNAQAQVDPAFMLVFDYSNRFDKEMAFVGNNVLSQEKLLERIKVYNNDVDRLLWQYDFRYRAGDAYNTPNLCSRMDTINFSCDGKRYNPTVINWNLHVGPTEIKDIDLDGHCPTTEMSGVKFTGDFNGDGYSDAIGLRETPYKMDIFLNNGHTQDNSVSFSEIASFERSQDLDWIYVGDFDGDGLDDFMCVIREQGWLFDHIVLKPFMTRKNDNGEVVFVECNPLNNGDFLIGQRKELTLVMGDFLGEKKMSFVFQTHKNNRRRHIYIYYNGDYSNNCPFDYRTIPDLNPAAMRAADFDGDGRTEIWYYSARESEWFGKIVRMTSDFQFETVNDRVLARNDKVFVGDFNGDGHSDFLSFVGNDNVWKIHLFKESRFHWQSFDITNIMPIGDPGDHGFTIVDDNGKYKAVEVADFNGDGKSDIAAIENSDGGDATLVILFAPFTANNCAHRIYISLDETDIQSSKQKEICVGNFLGRESVTLFSRNKSLSCPPFSARYSVMDITDGLGNKISFRYDYLMPGRAFYNITHLRPSLNDGCFAVALPLKGITSISKSNIYCRDIEQESVFYSYQDAIIHNRGRGFLGFESVITSQGFTNGKTTLHKRHFSRSHTGNHCSLLLDYDSCFVTHRDHYHRYLAAVDSYSYTKKVHSRNDKVYLPMTIMQISDQFDIDNNGQFLNRTVAKYSYDGLSQYQNTVHCVSTVQATGLGHGETNAENAEYRTVTDYEYQPENYSQWIVNRPCSTKTTVYRRGDSNHPSSIATFDYGDANPYEVRRQVSYPGGSINPNDSFATYVDYEYDAVGNIDISTSGDLLGTLPTTFTDYEYYPNYRQQKRLVNQAGYETSYTYERYYGGLETTTDCNGIVTRFSIDPLGVSSQTIRPDGIVANSNTDWVGDWDEMKPDQAKYYTSTCSTGKPESRTYYDATGRELRSVTYGFDGQPICVDTKYNGFGHVKSVSEPFYFSNIGTEKRTVYEYDGFHRNNKTIAPDETSVETTIDGFTATTTHHPKPGSDLPEQQTSATVNAAGWTIESVDANGTAVHYEYYPDGKLKWTQIGEDETTRISLEYDNAGNRILLADPNYGTVTSVYNAYGQLCLNTDPKGNTTEYLYDNLGRNIERIETNAETNEVETTNWFYDWNGKDQLDYVQGKHQYIQYEYDQLGRVLSIAEQRDTYWDELITNYEYDNLSRVRKVTYPTGYSIRKEYNDLGYLTKIKSEAGLPLWETIEVNEFGQIKRYKLGEDIINSREFDESHRLEATVSEANGEIIQSFSYGYDDFSNLASRKDEKRGMEETFLYDGLNRLTTITLDGVESSMKYDAYGRIHSKMADGHVVFGNAQYNTYDDNGMLKPHAISGAEMENILPELGITYTMFDKASRITGGYMSPTVDFDYGFDHQRTRMRVETSDGSIYEKAYIGNCEFVAHNGNVEKYTFISGPLGVFAVDMFMDNGCHFLNNFNYVLKDHLGSWTTITDADGYVEREQSFDAWGNARNAETWMGSTTQRPMFDRGYTGHEHLFDVGLINMNGRMYDPVMSSFLSVDSYVQQPDNSQSFNRYAYCLNNPLKYTDPSGEIFGIDDALAAAVICSISGVVFNGIGNLCNGRNFYDGSFGAFMGGAVGGYVGEAVSMSLPFGGFYNGAISGFAGGGNGGFVSGFTDSFTSGNPMGESLLNGMLSSGVGALSGGLLGGLSRGIADYMNGYGFWDGIGDPLYFMVDDMPDAYDANPEFDLKRWPNNRSAYNRALNDYAKSEKGFLGFNPEEEMRTVLRTEAPGLAEVNERGYLMTELGEAYGCTIPYSGGNSRVCISPTVIDMIGTEKGAFFATVLGHEYTHAYHNYVGLIGPTTINPQDGPSELEALKFTRNYSYRHGVARTQLSMYRFNLLDNCSIPNSYVVPAKYPFSTLNYPWP